MSSNSVSKAFRVLRTIKNVVLAVVIVFLTAVLAAVMYSRITGNAPSLFGYSMFRVSSGSMSPELEVGDVILVGKCDPNELKKDDIVTYVSESGDTEGKMITHRVIEPPYTENGASYIKTKGDANLTVDSPVLLSKIEGRFITKISVLKYVFDVFVTPWGLIILIALIIFAFFNEIVIFVKAVLGIGYEDEPKESVEDIIARYQKENAEKKPAEEPESSDEE